MNNETTVSINDRTTGGIDDFMKSLIEAGEIVTVVGNTGNGILNILKEKIKAMGFNKVYVNSCLLSIEDITGIPFIKNDGEIEYQSKLQNTLLNQNDKFVLVIDEFNKSNIKDDLKKIINTKSINGMALNMLQATILIYT